MTLGGAYIRRVVRAMDNAIDYGWDETLPRTLWQCLLRRPATIVHHYGIGELVDAFAKEEEKTE